MAEKIDIIINGIDNATKNIQSVTKSIGGLDDGLLETIQSLTGFNIASFSVAGGIALVGTAIVQAVEDTLAYNKVIEDTSVLTGDGIENTSRLVQISNDLSISQKDLTSSLEAANKKGISPTIAGLMTLSDKYLFLQTTVERNQFLLENFGASGLEMADMMELGAAGILKMTSAVEDSKVVTEDNIKEAKAYKKALDELTTTFDGLAITVGNKVIPILERNLSGIKSYIDALKIASDKGNIYGAVFEFINLRVNENAKRTEEAAESMFDYTAETKAGIQAAKDAAEVEKLLTKQIQEQTNAITTLNKTRLSMVTSFQSAEESYQTKFKSLNEERLALEADRTLKISQGYSTQGDVIQEIDNKLSVNNQKVQENAAEYEKASKKILLGYLEQNLARDGLSTKETAFLLEKGREWGIYSDTAINAMTTAMAEADRLAASINGIPNRDVYITTHYITDNPNDNFTQGFAYGAANGANFIVPPGFPNDSFPLRVQSGEHVQVTPAGKTSTNSNGVTLVYSPMISLATLSEAENVLLPMLRKLQRAA